MTSADRVSRARSLQTPADSVDLYRDWASTYDHDVFDVMGFIGTHRVADLLAEHVPDRSASVVDLGCGTGVSGVRLAQHGFTAIDGVDISPEMLAVASGRGVYRRAIVADLNVPGSIDDRYDASVSAGTFTSGHVDASALPAIAAVLRPGAVVAWVIAETMWPSFETAIGQLGFEMLHAALEPIRRDAPPEAMIITARLG
jgi:predicted TPR repeat methyltransferase